jgi:hypothetical protein
VFDLSLSRVLEMAWSWCFTSFVDIDESYGVFPALYLLVMLWVFPMKFCYWIESLRI